MPNPFSSRAVSRRLAVGFVVTGLLLSGTGLAYLAWSGGERTLPALPTTRAVSPDLHTRSKALLRSLMLISGMALMFIVGSYAMVKIGRAFLARRERRSPTQYVDAWSNYRLTEDEIERTMSHLEDPRDGPAGGPPDERPPA